MIYDQITKLISIRDYLYKQINSKVHEPDKSLDLNESLFALDSEILSKINKIPCVKNSIELRCGNEFKNTDIHSQNTELAFSNYLFDKYPHASETISDDRKRFFRLEKRIKDLIFKHCWHMVSFETIGKYGAKVSIKTPKFYAIKSEFASHELKTTEEIDEALYEKFIKRFDELQNDCTFQ